MNEQKVLACAECKNPLQVKAIQHTETVSYGPWRAKEKRTYYAVSVQCNGCGLEIGLYHLPANECLKEVISFVKKAPHTTYDDTVAVVKRLGFSVDEDGFAKL